ncbi:MAG TPA: arylesterase [Aestuariivirgaceae bacterium]|nr:arylesterase [Aestuariivirgaceae bacterium]
MRLVSFLTLSIWLMTAAFAASPIKLVVFGDSLTAGFGINPAEAFPVKLEAALRQRGLDVIVENAGVSGDTAKQGLERLEWSLAQDADAVIVELGANDALRGVDPNETRKSLNEIIAKLRARATPVMIAGMLAPPNLGAAYKEHFDAIYPSLAREHGILLYPFFLEGIAGEPAFNLEDGIHPNPRGIDEIVKRMLPKVEEFLAMVQR